MATVKATRDLHDTTYPSDNEDDKNGVAHVEKVEAVGSNGGFDDSIENTKPAAIVWMITACVAMGGFLFGTPIAHIITRSDH